MGGAGGYGGGTPGWQPPPGGPPPGAPPPGWQPPPGGPPPFPGQRPPKRKRGCGTAALITVVVLLILGAILAVIGYYAANPPSSQRQIPTTTSPTGPGPAPGPSAPPAGARVTKWMDNTSPAAWDPVSNRIYFNRRDDKGTWTSHSAMPDGSDSRCLMCDMKSPTGTRTGPQQGVSDVTPDGKYLISTVEKAEHPAPNGSSYSAPGRGLYNDLWLIRTDGSEGWPLTDLTTDPVSGVIWPRFDRTGTQIVWAQMYQGFDLAHPLGKWSMRVARVEWDGDRPVLKDERTFDPQEGRFYEPYQFSPDNSRIIFASDYDTPSVLLGPSQTNVQIWTIDVATLRDVQRVSPDQPISGMFSNYNEFAYYLPTSDGSRVMFARTAEATDHGMDIWTATADGQDPQRLTFLNEPDHEQHVGYAVMGGVAFDPKDPKRFVVGVSQSLDGESLNAYFVTLS